MQRTKEEWITLASKRILRVLAKRMCWVQSACSKPKYAKLAPATSAQSHMHSLRLKHASSKTLRFKSFRRSLRTRLPFSHPNGPTSRASHSKSSLATRRHLYLIHKGLADQKQFCSDVLEQIIDTALERSHVALFHSHFPNQNLPADRPLDFVVEIGNTHFSVARRKT
jgi:hypothetical protein